MKIKFTLDCFKEEFIKNILSSLNCDNYYKLLQNLKKINFELDLELNEENIEDEVYIKKEIVNNQEEENNIELSQDKNIKLLQENEDKEENNIELSQDKNIKLLQENEDKEENNQVEEYKKNKYQLLYYEKENALYLESNSKKHIPKGIVKKIKRQGGKWIKKENSWKFTKNQLKVLVNEFGAEKRDFTSDSPIKEKMENSLQNKSIEKIIEVDGDLVIIPLQNHTMYGKKITYDNNFNMGIWDNNLKGWKFKISKN